MRSSSAVKKELSGRKLSTVPGKSGARVPPAGFDRLRLVSELLSLGNDKITPELAHLVSEEVEAELKRRAVPQLSAELISEIVQFKLEELGLIEIRRRRQKRPSSTAEELTVTLHPTSGSEPGGLSAKIAATQLPTLEKFLRPQAGSALAAKSGRPLPPKAGLKISERALRKLRGSEGPGPDDAEIAARLERLFEEVATTVAGAEHGYASTNDPETLAVEFFNGMANQEFYPHLPVLSQFLDADAGPTSSSVVVRLAVPAGVELQSEVLAHARNAWQAGSKVVFSLLEPDSDTTWTSERFAQFLNSVEAAMMSLPEQVEIPRTVGLRLPLHRAFSLDCVREALSGKYYPRFQLELACPEAWELRTSGIHDAVLQETWKKSEPGLVCLDSAFGASYHPPLGIAESGHPGVAPALSLHEGASLGSLNLSIVVAGDDVDWAKLRRITRTAVHFLDNLLDILPYSDETLRQAALQERRLGLGVMGFAELLLKLGIPYDSEEAAILAEKILRFVRQEAMQASQALAEQREPSRPEGSALEIRRHLALTAIAVEPALADLAEVTPGIEPLAAVVEADRPIALLKLVCQRRRVWNDILEAEVLRSGSVRDCLAAPRPLRMLFATRHEIGEEWRLRIQAACQRHCDAPLRVELALPETASLQDLKERIAHARELGLRSFRIPQNPQAELAEVELVAEESVEASPSEDPIGEALAASLLLTLEDLASAANEAAEREDDSVDPIEPALEAPTISEPAPPSALQPRPRPEVLQANARLIQTGCGPMHVSFARDTHGPFEVRAQLGKTGSCASAQTEAISRLLTLCLSTGVDQKLVYEQLRGIRCPKTAMDRGDKILSCSDGIARVFERELGLSRSEPEELTPHFDDEEEITAVTDAEALN